MQKKNEDWINIQNPLERCQLFVLPYQRFSTIWLHVRGLLNLQKRGCKHTVSFQGYNTEHSLMNKLARSHCVLTFNIMPSRSGLFFKEVSVDTGYEELSSSELLSMVGWTRWGLKSSSYLKSPQNREDLESWSVMDVLFPESHITNHRGAIRRTLWHNMKIWYTL